MFNDCLHRPDDKKIVEHDGMSRWYTTKTRFYEYLSISSLDTETLQLIYYSIEDIPFILIH